MMTPRLGWAAAAAMAFGLGGPARAQVDSCDQAGAAAWKAVEGLGGVVPEIDEDRTQAPPAWWRYPNPRRSAELLAAESRDPGGLYERVAPADLKSGDIVVRAAGAGACGKMAVLAGELEGRWMLQDAAAADGASRTSDDAFFADGAHLRSEAAAYRVRIKSDSSRGHARALSRDLEHLERTIAERPPLLARGGREAVDVKVHELIDEAWSLQLDPELQVEGRVLAGRALALAAALDWPGAAESAAAVLDDALGRAPGRADAALARANVHLLTGQPAPALELAHEVAGAAHPPARSRYVLGRALLAAGKPSEGLVSLRRYVSDEPRDPRASKLVATAGREPALAPAPAAEAGLRFTATSARAGVTSSTYGFRVDWPIPWRVVTQSDTPGSGLLLDLVTGRVLDDEGTPARGAAVVLAQRPASAAERTALVKKAGRTIFPEAKLKTLPPLVPGSRHESFREKRPAEGGVGVHEGEITTIERGGVVYFLVLNSPARATPKLHDDYVALVKSLTFTGAAP